MHCTIKSTQDQSKLMRVDFTKKPSKSVTMYLKRAYKIVETPYNIDLMETYVKLDIKDPKNWIPKEIFELYCGKKSDKLMMFYDKAVEKGKMNSLSLNWFAILFLTAWLGYRRQWLYLIVLSAMFGVLPFLEAFLSITIPNTSTIGVSIVIGLFTNSFLLTDVNKDFHKLRQKNIDNEEIKIRLKNKVSPSILYAVLSFFGSFAFIFCSTFLAETLIGLPS